MTLPLPEELLAVSRSRHPSARANAPPGVSVIGVDMTERDRAYAVGMVNRLRRLPGGLAERATVVLVWTDGEDHEMALARFHSWGVGRRGLELAATGRTFLEALDRLEAGVRRQVIVA